MRHVHRTGIAALAAATVLLGGCGSSGKGSGSTQGPAVADTAAAAAVVAKYTGQPHDFPVDEQLARRPAAGTRIAYLQCSTPICGLFAEQLAAAAKQLGVTLTVTKAGASASDIQAAMNSIVSDKPAAVILPAIEPSVVRDQLKELDQKGIPVFSNGVINAADYGTDAAFNDVATMNIVGTVLASWAVAEKGADSQIVFYTVPELSFSKPLQQAFVAQVGKLCARCGVRTVDLPVSTIGSTAPARVVSDLQSHPHTNVAVFGTEEAATGLPAALKTARLDGKVAASGFGPTPDNLQDIKNGTLSGGLVVDTFVINYSLIDAAARAITGQKLTSGEKAGIPPLQLVTAHDLTGDVSKGFAVFPDFADRFARLWSVR